MFPVADKYINKRCGLHCREYQVKIPLKKVTGVFLIQKVNLQGVILEHILLKLNVLKLSLK